MRAFIVAFIVFGLTLGISILVLGRFGMSDNQSLPPSRAAEITLTVGTLIACAVAASHWLLPQPGWWCAGSLMFIYKTCGKARAEGPLTDRATNLKAAAREI
jgi:uncharacterized membrane protein YczE